MFYVINLDGYISNSIFSFKYEKMYCNISNDLKFKINDRIKCYFIKLGLYLCPLLIDIRKEMYTYAKCSYRIMCPEMFILYLNTVVLTKATKEHLIKLYIKSLQVSP